MKRLIREIHRRSLWQILGVYAASSWVILQVVGEIAESVALPSWVQPLALVILLLGLPMVLTTAFVQEGFGGRGRAGSPEGSESASGAETAAGASPLSGPPSAAAAIAAPTPATGTPAPRAGESGGGHRWFTWRNAIMGGAAAFALLGLLTAAYLVARTAGIGPAATLVAQGVLEERDRVLLADFANRTSDEPLGDVVTEALRVDLAQSQVVRLAEPAFVGEALQRMERPAGTALDETLARELARREGIKAVIAGEIGEAGGSYVLTARVVSPGTGEILASSRESASGDALITAIDRISKRLRERLGESLRSLGGDPPLERVTTANLAALDRYTQAVRAIDFEADWQRGIALLEEAVALDTAFAMAHRKLGQELLNRGIRLEDGFAALTRAFEHRDRLTETERAFTMGSYYAEVAGEPERAAQVYENLLARDPTNDRAINNLGAQLATSRQWDRAAEAFERAIALDSFSVFPYTNAAIVKVAQGKPAEAGALLEAILDKEPHNWMAETYATNLRLQQGDEAEALALAEHLEEEQRGNPFFTAGVEQFRAHVAALHGRVGEAERGHAEAERIRRLEIGPPEALQSALETAELDLFVRQDPARAAARLRSALERYPLDELPPADRPYGWLTGLLALSGEVGLARRLLGEWEASLTGVTRRREGPFLAWTRGAIALAERRPGEAISQFRAADRGECEICILPWLADAYDRAGQPDSALSVYERFIETPALFRLGIADNDVRGSTLERLGELHDAKGDLENAAKYYAMFVELWTDADDELQPRVRAAQARLEEILRERG